MSILHFFRVFAVRDCNFRFYKSNRNYALNVPILLIVRSRALATHVINRRVKASQGEKK